MKIIIIAAVDEKNGLGKDNKLSWKNPSELKHFYQMTKGKTLAMGRTTWESIPGTLPTRDVLVLSTAGRGIKPAKSYFNNIDSLIKYGKENNLDELWICGGAQIYNLFIEHADEVLLTRIHASIDADCFLPKIDEPTFHLCNKSEKIDIEGDQFTYHTEIWRKY